MNKILRSKIFLNSVYSRNNNKECFYKILNVKSDSDFQEIKN
jgi:hypothetical protein